MNKTIKCINNTEALLEWSNNFYLDNYDDYLEIQEDGLVPLSDSERLAEWEKR